MVNSSLKMGCAMAYIGNIYNKKELFGKKDFGML